MSIVQKLKLLFKIESTYKEVEEGIKMKNATKVVAAVIALLTAVVQIPSIQEGLVHFIVSHPAVSLALGGISGLLALIHNPKARTIVNILLLGILIGGFCPTTSAQTLPSAPVSELQNIYGVGASWNNSAQPPVAGTLFYGHRLNDSGTYGFSILDVLTNTVKPFTVTTNIGAGVAQKVATIAKLPIFMPTTAGISFNGQNVGWEWNGGAATLFPINKLVKKASSDWYLMPTVRFLKSSVSNGTGYQLIFGSEICWGK